MENKPSCSGGYCMQQMIKKKKKEKKRKDEEENNLNHSCSERTQELCLNKSTTEVKMLIFFFRMLKTVNKDAYIHTKTFRFMKAPLQVEATAWWSQATFQNKPTCFTALVMERTVTGGEITLSDYVF